MDLELKVELVEMDELPVLEERVMPEDLLGIISIQQMLSPRVILLETL